MMPIMKVISLSMRLKDIVSAQERKRVGRKTCLKTRCQSCFLHRVLMSRHQIGYGTERRKYDW